MWTKQLGRAPRPTAPWCKTMVKVMNACKQVMLTLCMSMHTRLYRRQLHTRVQQWGRSHPGGRLYWGGLKDFADGSLGSQTALMHQPYASDPSSSGIRLTPQETLQELVAAADMAGLQVTHWLLDSFLACSVTDMPGCKKPSQSSSPLP